jgi:hypothetical protein
MSNLAATDFCGSWAFHAGQFGEPLVVRIKELCSTEAPHRHNAVNDARLMVLPVPEMISLPVTSSGFGATKFCFGPHEQTINRLTACKGDRN